jgi:putative ABC transport system substrate-binding protein
MSVARLAGPAQGPLRESIVRGGLMTYRASIADSCRLAAIYRGKSRKRAEPGGVPAPQPTRLERVTDRKTAKAPAIEMPAILLALAGQVIE